MSYIKMKPMGLSRVAYAIWPSFITYGRPNENIILNTFPCKYYCDEHMIVFIAWPGVIDHFLGPPLN